MATTLHDILGAYRLPTGQNLTVAICAAMHNEEDSIVFNKDAIDAGYGCSSLYKTYTVAEKRCKRGNRVERTEKIGRYLQEQCAGYKINCDYSKLDQYGIIKKGSRVYSDTILVQKVEPRASIKWSQSKKTNTNDVIGTSTSTNKPGRKSNKTTKNTNKMDTSDNNIIVNGAEEESWDDQVLYTDTSFCNRSIEGGEVADVYPFINEQTGCKVVRIKIRNARIPEEGDKFSSRHGQKGTIGKIEPSEDIPYDPIPGTTVDIMYNPCAFISRMTYGQKIETLLGIICALTGEFGDASPHSLNYRKVLRKTIERKLKIAKFDQGEALTDISEALAALGYPATGSVSMICGRTNKRMTGLIYKGTTYMQKLKHMVKDKVRGRSRGRMNMATKQASEGRVLDGGLKYGEMECAATVSYGAASVVQDKMFFSADTGYIHLCKTCHIRPIYHEENNFTFCLSCHRKNNATNNFSPCTFSDFAGEIQATGLHLQLETRQLTVEDN